MPSRRHFIKFAASSVSLLAAGCQNMQSKSSVKAHVVIIGGGFAGASAAKIIKKLDPLIQVTLIEANKQYLTCPGSNWVFAGLTDIQSLTVSYQNLQRLYGIKVVHERVASIEAEKHSITLTNQQKISYDRLIVSPGIDFRWDTIEGHDESSTDSVPHAWKAGVQTTLLNGQLHNMHDGGTVVICAPPNPYRCPPGPYERASMMAYYLKQHKPNSKIIILDPKTQFSKQHLFIQGWRKYYDFGKPNSLIEWHSIADNPVLRIDPKSKLIETDFGDRFKADVLNYIPAQKAAHIAQTSGLCDDSGWCPVNHQSSESTLLPDIHVIGDASIHAPIPKSAFAANAEAKVCAFAIVSLINQIDPMQPTWINTCYSLITAEQGISIAMVYKLNQQGKIAKVKGAGGVTANTDEMTLALEATNAKKWLKSIVADSFM